MPCRDDTLAEIARQKARLAELERERAAAADRIAALEAGLIEGAGEARDRPAGPTWSVPPPATMAERVALFRRLFRGREDVFPKRWESRKGTQGYSPVCDNEWSPALCDKPRTRCSKCDNRKLAPVTDRVVREHLEGRHVIGVYPLLLDETCWFVAADFDGLGWADDVAAFRETCRAAGLPVAVERSRSGKGAHAWFFFAAPVPASTARKMACCLLTETMNRRHELAMTSYDRLFPNQDTMPKGGFGNLIALPLQPERVKDGNTVFLDERLVPYSDQWALLAGAVRIEPHVVETIAVEAARKGRVIGLRLPAMEDDPDPEPWTRPPSGRRAQLLITEPVPKRVQAVLAQRLFVEKEGLPAALITQLKRIAAFQNPMFYRRQAARLSTHDTPRVITCAKDSGLFIELPRACVDDAAALLGQHGAGLDLRDERTLGEPLDVSFAGRLTAEQQVAADAMLQHDVGVFVAPPGSGKTVLGIFLAAARARNVLVLVHRGQILDQWRAQLATFLDAPAAAVGQIGAGTQKPTGKIDVAMVQSVVRLDRVDDAVAQYGHVIFDECHHLPAISFDRVAAELKARYVLGLTATPYRSDGLHPILHMQCGPIHHAISVRDAAASQAFVRRLVVRPTAFEAPAVPAEPGIQALYRALVGHDRRNLMILDDVIAALEEGRSPIVLTERVEHLEWLESKLRGFAKNLVVLRGGMSAKQRRDVAARLASIPDGEERLLLATAKYLGEGFDDARLDTLFLTMPFAWKGSLVQYAGRLHRLHAGKTEVRVIDYVDEKVPVLARMFQKRLRGYRALGYEPEGDRAAGTPEAGVGDGRDFGAAGGSEPDGGLPDDDVPF
ncbi:MAG: DEAD/DEAH box helicase [Deltaproteobacteria bacterium]|nr:DEAD/DEAH box helicase [Deltaproteobacteria bacterium]